LSPPGETATLWLLAKRATSHKIVLNFKVVLLIYKKRSLILLSKKSNMLIKRFLTGLTILVSVIVFAPDAGFSLDNTARAAKSSASDVYVLPQGFVYLKEIIPDVAIELRYYTKDNFVGERIDGYLDNKGILTLEAALALKKVQDELKQFGLGLKVFDAYRPQSAVNHFVRWAEDLEDKKTKEQYYPDVSKEDLFKNGYIAARSSHSRGSTVDITIIDLETKGELDMGSGFDFFGPITWPSCPYLTVEQRANRMLLRIVMEHYGFEPYEQEWWHFTLRGEPFPEQYFNFPVK